MATRTARRPACERAARNARMKWWREARYGMFIHYNMFSRWRDEDYKELEGNPKKYTPAEHDRLRVEPMKPTPAAIHSWARTAKAAGMKYCVLTTKHNGGFCLWNSKVNKFNAVRMGPKFDVVGEYVKACRANGLKVGFYYALNDRHNGLREAAYKDNAARNGILKYTRGLLRELMSSYGKISILWYDEPCPMGYGGEWDSEAINAMVRRLQPGIIINDRSLTYQDFTGPERHITPTAYPDQDWESCMTLTGTWAYDPKAPRSPRNILDMLWQVTHGGGNLLLNVGPHPHTGRIRNVEADSLKTVGKWLKRHGPAVYGSNDRPEGLGETKNNVRGKWTRHDTTAYLWLFNWPKTSTVTIRKARTKLLGCRLLTTRKALKFKQDAKGITVSGLPKKCPDDGCGVGVIEFKFAEYPR